MITVEQGVALAHDQILPHDPLWALKLANVATDLLVSNYVTRESGVHPAPVWGADEYSYRMYYPAGVVGHYEISDGADMLVNVTTPTLEVK